VKEHSDGNVTIRQIASLTDLSTGIAYDLVEALYSILDLGDNELAPTTYTRLISMRATAIFPRN